MSSYEHRTGNDATSARHSEAATAPHFAPQGPGRAASRVGRTAAYAIVVAGGLFLGLVVGAVIGLFTGLIDISC